MSRVIGIIPARYSSQRLKAKPLVDIDGLPMIIRIWKNIFSANLLNEIVIATDDKRISDVCEKYNCPFVMTDTALQSGTERIFQAYQTLFAKENSDDIIVNIQSDEPLLMYTDIDLLLCNFIKTNYDVGTLIVKIENNEDIFDTNSVKVVLDKNNCAMYFSRSPIPYIRDLNNSLWCKEVFWKHIGIYAYRKFVLEDFVKLPYSNLEQKEKLEQLRLLEKGYKFYCIETKSNLISVDTEEDLEKVRSILIK